MGCGASNITEVKPLSIQQRRTDSRATTRIRNISAVENGTPIGLQFSDPYSSMMPDFHTPVETLGTNWNCDDEAVSMISEVFRKYEHTEFFMKYKEPQRSFITQLSEEVVGRDSVLSAIRSYISDTNPLSQVPLLLHSEAGRGKTAVLAKLVTTTATEILQRMQSSSSDGTKWYLFHYFVRSVPKSSNLEHMLRCLLIEIGAVNEFTLPRTLTSLVQLTYAILSHPHCRPIIIIIDSLDQFDEVFEDDVIRWIPRRLSGQIRLIFSMETGSKVQWQLKDKISAVKEMALPSLSSNDIKKIATRKLQRHGKELNKTQEKYLLARKSSENLAWLNIACDYLGFLEDGDEINSQLERMPNNVDKLLTDVISRFEDLKGRPDRLLAGFLFLLRFSKDGMKNSELRWILGDQETIFPIYIAGLGDIKITFNRLYEQLADEPWEIIFRAMLPFIREVKSNEDDNDDPRYVFKHHIIGNAVQQMSFLDGEEDKVNDDEREENTNWWHSKLADYFELESNFKRKIEEYPFHVAEVGNQAGGVFKCFTNWQIFQELLQENLPWLLAVWDKTCTTDYMVEIYKDALHDLEVEESNSQVVATRYGQVAEFMFYAGEYDTAKEFIAKAIKSHPDNEDLVRMYTLAGDIFHEHLVSMSDCLKHDYKEELRELLRCYKKAIKIRQRNYLAEDKHKYLLVSTLCKYVENLHLWLVIFDSEHSFNANELRQEADEHIAEAIRISKEVRNYGMLAEAFTTKALLKNELKLYAEAVESCLRAYGENHPLTAKLNGHIAQYYESSHDWKRAARHYLLQLRILTEIYGVDHTVTKATKEKLQHPRIAKYVKKR
ncbi:TPR repeat-containing protein DDB_G0287407-like [Ptychodera flava]|uniref:TPR repeat-containing protein DDB_G0287407-like n=1 Tax=Ptychodera flava TaxID=63121 RepID=UPI00396A9D37